MIKQLRFKNWRSLREVVIDDLTPLTVLIGANSSGKTNIIDGLHFLRESHESSFLRAIQSRGGDDRIHSAGVDLEEPTEVEFTFQPRPNQLLTNSFSLKFNETPIPDITELLQDADGKVWLKSERTGFRRHAFQIREQEELRDMSDDSLGDFQTTLYLFGNRKEYEAVYNTFQFITWRWQILLENFFPPLSLRIGESGDNAIIDKYADNVPAMLNFMRLVYPTQYKELQDDLQWLLGHVESLSTESDEHETRFLLRERIFAGKEAPTISAGTARLVAMLTAVYALDMTREKMPGLVVIEEPDTALHPWLLQRFVEQLRTYAAREDHPRQFILTTHNPRLLDYFQPQEIRIVERGEDGYTQVRRIPDHIKDIWLDEFGLGEVWSTGSFGGVPQ